MTMNNLVDPDNPNHTVVRNRSPRRIDNQPGLHPSMMSDEQLTMVADTWQLVKDTDTPVGNLRTAMSDSGLFDFNDSQTNNLELHKIAVAAQDTLELRSGSTRADEIRAIVDVTEGKNTADEVRIALSDLLGEHVVDDMSDDEIARFVGDARTALSFLDTATDTDDGTAQQGISNRELADQVSDILDGQLVVNDATDRVQYGAGATAGGQRVGGQFASKSQLHAIADNADQIRDGLADRGTPDDGEDTSTTDAADTHAGPDTDDTNVDTSTGTSSSADTDTSTTPTGDSEPSTSTASHDVSTGVPATPDVVTDTSPTTPDNPVVSKPEAQGPLVLTFIDETFDAIAAARDAAEARRRNELAEGGNGLKGKVKRFFRNMWKGENGLAGAYYLEKYKREAIAQIEQENDTLALESSDAEARTRAQVATIERFQSDYDESIHQDAGERREKIENDSEFALAMKDLIRRYASGEITDPEALKAEQGRALEQLAKNGQMNLIGEGKVRLDNLLAIAEQVKAIADNEDSINRMLDGMKMYNAEARSNVRTEHELSKAEQLIDRLQRSGRGLGGLVGPETLGTAAAIALGIARAGRGTLIHAAGVTVAPGVLGGAFAAMRERKRVKQERTLHAREMAQGKEYATGSKQREALEDTRYETEDAQTLTTQLESLLAEGQDYTPEQTQSAYEAIAQIEARIRMSDKRKIDLVSYSSVVDMAHERRQLDEARALAKVRLAGHLSGLPSDFRDRFKIVDGQPIDEALGLYTGAIVELDKDIDAKDKAFRKLRRRRTAIAAGIGFGTSLVIGLGAQEALAFASPSYDGLAEHIVHGDSPSEGGRQTLLEGMFNGSSAHTEHITPSATYDSYAMGSHQGALELPSNYHAVTAPNGTMTIEGPKGFSPIEGITLEKDGSLSPESVQLLKDHNISIADTGAIVQGKEQVVTQNMSIAQYNTLHSSDTFHVARDFPYDRNTTMPDGNERKLWWAGEGDKGLGKSGNIQMSVSHMTEGGSYHGNNHVSWAQAAHDGKLKLAVSASRDTQSHVYFVDVKPDGGIDIPKDNPASKFFSVDKDGQAQFNGAYAEVVEVRGVTDGVTHIAPLATEVGHNSLTEIPEKISKPTQVYVPHVKLTPPAFEQAVQGRTVEGFGMPGFVPRRPLEVVSRRRAETQAALGYDSYRQTANGEYGRPEGADKVSPRLETDPKGKLVLGEELQWFAQELEKSEGADYMQHIHDDIQNSPELQSLPRDLRTITTIPVAAASESDNIYKTLSLYAQQDELQLKRNAILLNVNWIDTVGQDPAKRVLIDKTFAEIERARRDFPELHIATMTREYNGEEVKKTGGVIGYVARDLLNTALISIHEQIKKNAIPFDADVAIVRQDADMRGISRHYLRQLERGMEKNPNVDIFHGTIRSDVPMQDRYPGLGIVTNFSQAMSAANAAANRPWTVGINAVVRASSMAAVGGLGRPTWTGAGSDDVNIAWRVGGARRGDAVVSPDSSTGYYQPHSTMDVKDHRIVVPVPGMSVDSSADRLIPQYLMGRHFGAAWDSRVSQGTSFSDGPGGYRDRNADAAIMEKIKREKVNDDFYGRIETNISGELQHANEEVARKVLSIFFAGTPNAYTITGNIGDGSTKFELTDAGREFIKRSVQREVDGSRGAGYGARKMRQLYGQKRGGRRSAAEESPYVAPLKQRKQLVIRIGGKKHE